ncbi:MAG: N-acetylmuramoyl-L-alanine amidase [Bacteroidetes bacterium]|nr:MAG: N-acetylmuramoyl-L-alanine amidase [Bacteroidota bacterium]PTM12850.1 MAG: N-acetylmuramoyl-L-alanine amidase [Bacteroidota bacterium]
MVNYFLVFLDAGHGGLDPAGNYVTSPSKEHRFSQGGFHNNGWFYEGVFNRTLTNRVALKLGRLGIPFYLVSHEYLDVSLAYRVELANWYARKVAKSLYISNHANAGGGSARGFEVYTSPGRTASDAVAELHWNNVSELLGERISRYRSDTSDGDHDKEARFYVLTKTSMPAFLVEHLFFDNYEDALQLMDDEIVERFAEAQVRTIIESMAIL